MKDWKLESARNAYGEALVDIGRTNSEVVVLDADLAHATQTCKFAEEFPERFYNIGIAEQNMVCISGGFALSGLTPIISTFSLFGAGRAYEQIRNTICYPKLNVKIALTHGGITVGEDGGSHQAIEDIALMRVVPNMTVIVPSDSVETRKAIHAAVKFEGPVFLRISRSPSPVIHTDDYDFEIGKGHMLRSGSDLTIIATGIMVSAGLEVAENLEKQGISATVINIHTIKPIDRELLIKHARETKKVVTMEEHSVIGGLGSAVSEVLASEDIVKHKIIGVNDRFGQSGSPPELLHTYGLDPETLLAACLDFMKIK